MLKAMRALGRKSTGTGELRHRTDDYLTRKQRIMDKTCLNSQHQNPNRARVQQSEEYIWQNICPPKQFQNGKDVASISNPMGIADEHAASSTDNSFSAH